MLSSLFKDASTLFPDTQIHIGGDEVISQCWKTEIQINDYKKKYDMNTRTLLQLFFNKVSDMLVSHHKNPIVWEDTVVAHDVYMPPNTIFQVWRNEDSSRSLIKKGYKVIISFYTKWYLDLGFAPWVTTSDFSMRSAIPWQVMYNADPTEGLASEEEHGVLGGEAAMWTEMVDEHNLESTVWPRAAAVAERLWSPKSTKLNHGTIERLYAHNQRLINRGIHPAPLGPTWCRLNPLRC
jgi:hexosaminidase